MKRSKNTSAGKKTIELLEQRRHLSTTSFDSGVLTLQGDANQNNTFYVRAASFGRVFGVADNVGQTADVNGLQQIIVRLGDKNNTVYAAKSLKMAVEAVMPDGTTYTVQPGQTETFGPGQSASGQMFENSYVGSTQDPSSGVVVSGTEHGTTVTSSRPGVVNTPAPTPTPTPAPSTPVNADSPNAVITVTDGQSILPGESVHVQALNSTFGSGDAMSSKIAWNFGDPNSAYNTLVGFNAAHAYDASGTYTVTLTITNSDGLTSTATTQVTVNVDNRTTIYVAANGNDANDGLSASDPIQSIARMQQLLTSDTRVLFHAGDTFTTASGINVNGYHDVYIGSYGTGNRPVLMYNGPVGFSSIITSQAGTEGLTVQGLTFDSIYTNELLDQAIPSGVHVNGSNITIRDNQFLNVLDAVNMELAPSNVLVQDNTSPSLTGLRAYFCWTQGSDIVIVGNTVVNSTRETVVRIGGADRVLIADNNLSNVSGAAWGDTQDTQKAAIAIQKGTYAYVVDNTIPSGPIGVGPLGTTDSDPNGSFNYCVFDSNTVNSTVMIQPGAHHILAENNVIYQNGNAGFTINAQLTTFNWQVQDAKFINNTVIDSSADGSFLSINNGEAQGIVVDNNLFVAPKLTTGDGTGIIQVADNDLSSFSEIKNNVWPAPTTSFWSQGGYFYVNSAPGVQAGYLTPAEWAATGVPSGDVYENVNLGSGFSITAGDFTAGSSIAA